jgi:2,3-bisphosphoglycerate-dependent phosphoglycerate mutase
LKSTSHRKDTTFLLVRHAHAEWIPDENRPLSQQGRFDALRVADLLAFYPIRMVISSPYLRARQTVEPLAIQKGLTIHLDERFRERHLGQFHPQTFEKAVRSTWDDFDFAHPGGETNRAAQARGLAGLRQVLTKGWDGSVLISTHGNLLALILQHDHPEVDFTFWRNMTMPDIYQFVVMANGITTYKRLWQQDP